jgi:hypothetical protein
MARCKACVQSGWLAGGGVRPEKIARSLEGIYLQGRDQGRRGRVIAVAGVLREPFLTVRIQDDSGVRYEWLIAVDQVERRAGKEPNPEDLREAAIALYAEGAGIGPHPVPAPEHAQPEPDPHPHFADGNGGGSPGPGFPGSDLGGGQGPRG